MLRGLILLAAVVACRDSVDTDLEARNALLPVMPNSQHAAAQDGDSAESDGSATPARPREWAGAAELPRAAVDVSLPAVTGRTIRVAAGRSVQSAIDAAERGDEIVLAPGATYTGTIVLKRKGGTGWITIRSAGSLPVPGTRVTPADAPQMARLVSRHASEPAIRTEAGASHYRLVGLEVTADPEATAAGTLVALGDASRAQDRRELQPHHLVLDRMYVHGHPSLNFQRCIALNSAATAIVDSWISECHGKGKDSQAIAGWNGTGPYLIENSHLAGAGENIMFGGADSRSPELMPRDITIRRNHFYKPPEWKGVWTVKNLFELKVGQRVLVEGNVFENNWAGGQTGFAILFKSVNQGNRAPWSETSDVTFRYNVVRNSAHGVNLHGKPEARPAVPASRITFAHNVFERIGSGDYPGGRLFQINGIDGLTLTHNTGLASTPVLLHGSSPSSNLVITDNILGTGASVIRSADGKGPGVRALDAHAGPGWIVTGNVFVGARQATHPPENRFPDDVAALRFINAEAGDFRIRPGSPFRAAGADVGAVLEKVAGVTDMEQESGRRRSR